MLFLKVYNFWRKRKGTLETSNTDKHHVSPCLRSFIFSDYYSWPNTTHLSLPIHSYPRPLQSLHCISLIPTVWNYTKCSTCVLPIWYGMFTYFLFPLISVIFQVDWITSSLLFPTPLLWRITSLFWNHTVLPCVSSVENLRRFWQRWPWVGEQVKWP